MTEGLLDGRIVLHCGDCRSVLAALEPDSIDAVVTDPPYHLTSIVKRFGGSGAYGGGFKEENGGTGAAVARMSRGFMGKQWDGGDVAFDPDTWRAVLRVLKPGGHLVAMGGTRTYHRMACAIEDAGFEVRDTLSWIFGSGFPKSHDVSKGIDRAAGAQREVVGPGQYADRGRKLATPVAMSTSASEDDFITVPATPAAIEWQGWGTALKPACELIVLARKPLSEGTVAANVLRWGTGAINVDGCRVAPTGERLGGGGEKAETAGQFTNEGWRRPWMDDPEASEVFAAKVRNNVERSSELGRWPANVVTDGSDEVTAAFPDVKSAGEYTTSQDKPKINKHLFGSNIGPRERGNEYANQIGSAARFFFQAKQDDPCHSINSVSDAENSFDLKSERAVSVLSNAVEQSTRQSVLHKPSYRAPDMNVSAQQFALIVASVTEAIQNIERRSVFELPRERLSVKLGPVTCVAIPNQIGTTTITVSLSTFDPSAEAVTFNIIETNAEVGAQGFAKRFWYGSKADADDRLGARHPTVKPLDLMQWLVRLVTPPRGTCLDLFAGTGTTGEAAWREGCNAVLIEAEPEYQADIRRRMALALAGPDERARESIKAKNLPRDDGPLFAGRETWAEMWAKPFDFSQEPK